MSVKGEAKSAAARTEQTSTPTIARSSQHLHEERLAQEVLAVWQDNFDSTPSSASHWRKKPAVNAECIVKQVEIDPFGCTCGPCKRFWKDNFTNTSILSEPVLKRAQKTSTMFRPEQADWRIRVGDRVIVNGRHTGEVQFVGLLDENVIAPTVYVGVKCDDNIGSTHNGTMNGKRYFHCARGHGALVPYTDVRRLNPAETRPALSGNYMFESYHDVVKTRALRRQKMEASEEAVKPRPKPPSRIRKTYTVSDENDIAYKDSQREGGTQVYHYANSTVKVRTGGPPKAKADPQARRFIKWKEEFGGGEKGERLVKTLKRLHEALNKGKMLGEEEEEEEELYDEFDEDEMADRPPTVHSSKPPTRAGDRSQTSRQPSPMKSMHSNPS